MRIWTERRHQAEVHHELIWASIGTLTLLATLLLSKFLSEFPHYHYPCMFLKLTGKPCLSCGMTRSFLCAARGEFLAAWQWNPLGLLIMVGTVLYTPYAWAVVLFDLPPVRFRLTRRTERIIVRVLVVAGLVANWIYVWNSPMPY